MPSGKKTGTVFDQFEQMGDGSGFHPKLSDMLEGSDMLRDFSRQDIEQIAHYVSAYEAPKGTVVLREGEKQSYMFILVSGRLDIFKKADSVTYGDKPKKIATVRKGKSVGEMSLLDGLGHSATAVAAEPVEILLVTKNQFDRLLKTHPVLGVKLLRRIAALMSLRLRQTSGVLIDYLKK